MRYSLLFLLCLFIISCNDKSQDLSKTCSYNDPLEDVEWLKETVQDLRKLSDSPGAEIIQYVYQDQCVFMIDDCFNCSDKLIRVYDYDQNLICEFGGIAGLNTCPDFEKEATDRQVLFERK